MAISDDARQRFVEAVRTRLDAGMADAGITLNGVYDDNADPPNRNTSILYEGVVSDFLARYPGLDPVWDQEWRSHVGGCVDLWINWSEVDDTIDVNLEHWEIRNLADRYGDESSLTAAEAALRRPGDIQERDEVIAAILEKSLTAASSRSQ